MNTNYYTLGLITTQIQRDTRNRALRNRRFEKAREVRQALRKVAR